MTFDADFLHFPNVKAFATYLAGIPRPAWCKGATVHNSYVPNEYQWRGLASMSSMKQTYIGKGWSAGPHLYLAAEAPDPKDTGIFQMTPIDHFGVHAGACNSDHLGIENVADWQARPPTPLQYELLMDVLLTILRQWGLPPSSVNVHRECMQGRTCPGRYLDATKLRADLAAGGVSSAWPRQYRFRYPQVVYTSRDTRAPVAAGATNGAEVKAAGDVVAIGDITNDWAWIASGIGFVPLGVLDKV